MYYDFFLKINLKQKNTNEQGKFLSVTEKHEIYERTVYYFYKLKMILFFLLAYFFIYFVRTHSRHAIAHMKMLEMRSID